VIRDHFVDAAIGNQMSASVIATPPMVVWLKLCVLLKYAVKEISDRICRSLSWRAGKRQQARKDVDNLLHDTLWVAAQGRRRNTSSTQEPMKTATMK
jgi:hypothetical protein